MNINRASLGWRRGEAIAFASIDPTCRPKPDGKRKDESERAGQCEGQSERAGPRERARGLG